MAIANITVNGNTYTDADWRANWEGTISAIANDIAAAIGGVSIAGGTLNKALSGNTTLTSGESGNRVYVFTGTLAANATVTYNAVFTGLALVVNNTTGGYSVLVGYAAGTTATIAAGQTALVYSDGTNFSLAVAVATTATGAKVTGTFEATGATTIGGTLAVTGATTMAAATLSGTLTGVTATFSGDVTVAEDLLVTGTGYSVFSGSVIVTSELTANTLAIANGATINGTGTVLEIAALSGEIRASLSTLSTAPAYFEWATTGIPTWVAGRDNSAQTGASSGGNWVLIALDDNGNSNGIVVKCYRDTLEFNLPNLPTSSAGLRTGSLYNDSGTLKVA